MFAAVEFLDEFSGQCDAVPLSWISEDQSSCFWPPKNINITLAKGQSGSLPAKNWKPLNIKVKYITGSRKKAEGYVEKLVENSAVDTSDISSSDESDHSPTIKKRQHKKLKLANFSYGDEDIGTPIRKRVKLDRPPAIVFEEQEVVDLIFSSNHAPAVPSSLIHSSTNDMQAESTKEYMVNTNTEQSLFTPTSCGENSAGFQSYVIRKLKEQSSFMREILDVVKQNKGVQHRELHSHVSGIPSLPMTTYEDFEVFDAAIRKEDVFSRMVTVLRSCGGRSVRDTTYAVLQHIFTDELAMEFNWAGIHRSNVSTDIRKRALRMTRTKDLIFGSVSEILDFATENEIARLTNDWLKAAKNRHMNKGKSTHVVP